VRGRAILEGSFFMGGASLGGVPLAAVGYDVQVT
jgi:hypothetical protein